MTKLRMKTVPREVYRRAGSLAAIVILALFTLGAGDQSQRFEKLGHEMICTCGCSQILLECNHVGCAVSEKMRAQLSAALQRGDTDAQILQAFVQEYGPTVMASPAARGFGRVAWIMPFAIFIAGAGLVLVIVRNWKLRPASMPVGTPRDMSPSEAESLRARAREETEL